MTETTTEVAVATSKEVITGKLNVALTRVSLGINMLNEMESKLVYNEDNIPAITAYIDKAKEAKKVIAAEHKAIKEEPLKLCQTIDESRRNMDAEIDGGLNRAQTNYTKMCQDIEKRKRDAEIERQRKADIQAGIDSNMMSFAVKISECKTNRELIAIESLINLEKGKKTKYAEFFDSAVEKYSTLTVAIKDQKEKVKEFERIEQERLKAIKDNDDAALLKAKEQQETLTAKIEENKVTVQESAINSATTSSAPEVAIEVIPEIKVKRKSWKWSVENMKDVAKKMPDWLEMKTVDAKIDEFMKASKDSWVESGKESVTINGINFFIEKTY